MYYSSKVSFVLFALVLTGAVRSVAVKNLYLKGFEKPVFVTILFHIANMPAFPIHWLYQYWAQRLQRRVSASPQPSTREPSAERQLSSTNHSTRRSSGLLRERSMVHRQSGSATETNKSQHSSRREEDVQEEGLTGSELEPTIAREISFHHRHRTPSYHAMGSQTGLTEESHAVATTWITSLPWYCYLLLLGVLSFITYLLRWGSFLSLHASVAEMLLNGLELISSAVAARAVRKRKISRARWYGVWIVTLGIIVVGVAELFSDRQESDDSLGSFTNRAVGIVLCFGVGFFATALVMLEELLTQEGDYAALIVMGYEGLWGTVLGIALYYPLAPLFGEEPSETWKALAESRSNSAYAGVMVAVFALSGMANIFSISTTSSMTRNIWQHLRSIPVWAIGLTIYYWVDDSDDSDQLGEPWVMPQSLFILLGFAVMLAGVYMYYHKPSPATPTSDAT